MNATFQQKRDDLDLASLYREKKAQAHVEVAEDEAADAKEESVKGKFHWRCERSFETFSTRRNGLLAKPSWPALLYGRGPLKLCWWMDATLNLSGPSDVELDSHVDTSTHR